MDKEMRVDLEEVLKVQRWRNRINKADLSSVVVYKDGKPLSVPEDWVKDWKYMGLNNWDFLLMTEFEDGG